MSDSIALLTLSSATTYDLSIDACAQTHTHTHAHMFSHFFSFNFILKSKRILIMFPKSRTNRLYSHESYETTAIL